MEQIVRYPRTTHIQGSKGELGKGLRDTISISDLKKKHLVIEEKMDGANTGVSFYNNTLMLQCRGHFLTGGHTEEQFNLFKAWANRWSDELNKILGERYIMFGEWMYAKHTIFYDKLPHYFLEFDMYDKKSKTYLSTPKRNELLKNNNFIKSVKVLYEGINIKSNKDLNSLLTSSSFIGEKQLDVFKTLLSQKGGGFSQAIATNETDLTGIMEGLYIKVEEDGIVQNRYKYIREGFIKTVLDSGSHWMDRLLLENKLVDSVDLFV